MRKITQKWAFLMMTLVCLLGMSQVVTAQTCVEFGEGTSSNNQLPLCGYYHSSYTQQLYLADELEISAGNITSIAFQYTHASSTKREITVYMANTDAESLSSGYITDAEFTEVLGQSVVEFDNSDDWFTIELETPFAYDGSSNLLVVVYMSYSSAEETSYNSNSRFAYTTATDMARYTTNDYTTSATELTVADGVLTANTNSYTGINGTVSGNRPNIQICYTTGGSGTVPCEKPSGITASDVTATGATLTWGDGSGVYNVEYKKAADEEWTSLLENSTLLTATLSDLDPSTEYQARVQSACAGNVDNPVSSWKTVSFTTPMAPMQLPLVEEFNTASLPANWSKCSGLLSDVLAGTATLTASSGSWTFGTGNGVFDDHAKLNIYGTSCKSWLVTPILAMQDNVQLSFDLALTTYSGTLTAVDATKQSDDIFAVLMSIDNGATWTVLRQWDNAGSPDVYNNIACSAEGEHVTIDLSGNANEVVMIAFYGESTVSGNGDNNLHIDNVSIDRVPDCANPTDLAVESITKNSATIAWEANADEEAWLLQYRKSGAANWTSLDAQVTENPFELTGLEEYTSYDVRVAAYCNPLDETMMSAFSKAVSFKTAATAPFAEAFTSLPSDWKRYSVLLERIWAGEDTLTNHAVSSGWTVSTGNGVYGVNHLKLQVYGESVKNWIVSPFVEMNEAEMQLTFDLALTQTSGTLTPAEAGAQDDDKFSVLVTTDGGETWEELYVRDNVTSADSYDNINCTADGQTVKIDLSAYTESTIAIAFYGESTVAGGNNYLHIRNFNIDTIPSCEAPMGLQVQDRGDTYAILMWDEAEDAVWEYALVVDTVANFVPADADFTGSATGYTVTISDLVAETDYAFYLRRNCGGAHSEYIERHFTTMPAPKQVPWREDFESFTNNTIATYWDNSASATTTAASTPYYVWGVYAYGGNKMLRMNNYSVQKGTALINSPAIVLPAEPAYELTFDYAHTATCGNFSVKVSLNNGATWIDLPQTFGNTSTGTDNTNPGEFSSATINLEEYANSTIMLQFFATSDYGNGAIFVDNVDIHEVPDCLKPMSLEQVAETEATTNSVQLDWMPQGTETNWLIQYKKASAEDWTVFDGDINAHPFTLTGLEASSAYNVRVAAWCDPTDSLSASDYSNAITVTTACDVISEFPYNENFDGITGASGGTTNVLPMCWSYINTSTYSSYAGYPNAYNSSSYAASGSNALKFYSYAYSSTYDPQDQYAILPEMEGISGLRMKFAARAYSTGSSYDATFTVGVMSDPTDTATFVPVATMEPAGTAYEPFEVKFNTYEGTGKYIAIKMLAADLIEDDYIHGVHIDNIVIDLIPDCFEPTAVKVVGSTATSVQFTYTAAAQGDSLSYAVVLKGAEPTEFTGITADTVLVEGLEASTEYMLYLRTECTNSASASISTTFQTKQLPIDLGDGFADDFEGANQWYFENGEIENAWVLGTAAHNGEGSTKAIYISNNGGASNAYTITKDAVVYAMKAFNIAAGSYIFQYDWMAYGESSSDYIRAALVPAAIELTASTSLPTGVTTTALPEGCIAIDGGSKLNLSSAWATYTSAELAVPAGTYNVVFMWRNDYSVGTQPPAAIDNFSITKILCGKPGTPTIEKANITSTSAEIAWTAEEGQTAWQIAMDTIAAFSPDTAQLISVNANPYLAENLLPEHTYYVYVRANCGENGFSAWSARASFKTAKACQKPDGLEVAAITDSSAVVTWNTYGQNAFLLTYGIGNEYGDPVEVTGGTYTITGLAENTTYKVKVAASCDETTFSSAKTFKTACSAIAAVVEDFDGITGSTSSHVLPDCWDYLNGGSSYAAYPLVYSGESYANSGSNSLKFYTYTGTSSKDQYAIMPAVNNLNTLRMKLNARKYSASYESIVVVGIMTDPTDAATFAAIDTIRPAGIAYEPFLVSFGEYTGEGKYVALKVSVPASSYSGAHIDDIVMEAIPSCLEPTALAVSDIATTSATLDWTSTASQWQILLNNDSLIDVAAKPFVLNELTSATNYTFAVRAICAEGDTSAWSNAMTFATECELISLANADYVEGFEAYEGSTYNDANGVAPVCWEVGTSGTVAPHVIGSGSYYWTHEGTKALTFYGSGDCYAILPKFAEPLNTMEISFWAAMESATTGTLYLGYITEEDPNTANLITSYDRTVAKEMAFYETSLDTLPATASQLVFWWASSSQWSCCIDDVTVSLIPACPKTTGLEATMVGDVLATFAWDAEEDVTWEYGLVVDTFTVTTFVPADADFTGTTLVNEVTINSLTPETSYLFFIRKVCGNEKSPVVFKSFSTIMTAAALPYDDDFENGNSWKLINGTCTNAWTVGSAATESGNALYISNDGGTTFEYTLSGTTIVYAAKVFNFDKAGSYTVSYDWRAYGEGNYDFLRVALVPATVELSAGSTIPSGFTANGLPTGWKALDGGSQLSLSNAWQNKSVVAENIASGYYYVVFAWKNDISGGAQNPAAVDNIHIQHLDYPTDIEGNAGITNQAVKFLHNNQVYILVNGVVYSITGQKVEVK